MPITIYVYIIGDSEIDIWGLSGRERLRRMVASRAQAKLVDKIAQIPDQAAVLLLRADYLFDDRVLATLISAKTNLTLVTNEGQPAAMRVSIIDATSALGYLINGTEEQNYSIPPRYTTEDLDVLGLQRNLKKRDKPYVLPISKCNRLQLESELFVRSYKGVTDLVTKWLWPMPAFWVTRLCVRWGLSPNQVTLLSLVLTLAAGIGFWHAYFGAGLIMAWLMTFFDTVDGKLARVTVTSSRVGDALDHGLDIIHPPLWYMAWAIGLIPESVQVADLTILFSLILIGYIGGRLCEGVFQFWIASFDIFIWRPLDSFNRLITARRNPNLILLTAGWLMGRPDAGLWAVIVWHLLSTLFLFVRVMMAWQMRRSHGPLRSWFEDIVPGENDGKLVARIFTPLKIYKSL